MKPQLLLSLLTACLLCLSCSASKQAFKKAQEYEEAGLYVEAAEQDLKALQDDPGFKQAKSHLRKIAPQVYDELLRRAETLEQAENWELAVSQYERLSTFVDRFHGHGIVIETINIDTRLRQARRKAAEKHYADAEALFQRQIWRKAADAYMQAHSFVDNFNGSFDKALQSYLRAGEQALAKKLFERAIDDFQAALQTAPGHQQAIRKLTESHLRYGRQLFDEGQFRKALAQFEQAEAYDPDSRELQAWADRAYEEAVQFVAIFPFANNTPVQIDGQRLAQDILALVETRDLKFVEFLSHPETISLVSQSAFSRYGQINESELRTIAADEGLDSFIWGSIAHLDVDDTPETFEEYQHDKVIARRDSAGQEVESTETIFYREYSRKRRVRIEVEYVILESETGKTLERQRFRQDVADVARWIAYQGSIYDLPENKRHLLDAPPNPRPVSALVGELLATLVEDIARDIVRFYR